MRALRRAPALAPMARLARWLGGVMPKGLYARSLIIIIAPVVLLQSVIAYVFMERHWQLVTRRLSSAVTADIAALIDIHETFPQDKDNEILSRIAANRLALDVDVLKDAELPPAGTEALLLHPRRGALRRDPPADRPAVLDRHGGAFQPHRDPHPPRRRRDAGDRAAQPGLCLELAHLPRVDGRLVHGAARASPSCSCATRSAHPAARDAAESFGKGRDVEFRPRGAREVRQAGHAFIEMKRRIERAIDQRTTMLNGVSHDLRTIMTRFKLSSPSWSRRRRWRT
jgi:two-component system osmolarity sensor histidine kinase EnvZ